MAKRNGSARFWNWMAQRYNRQPIADEASYQKKVELTRAYFRSDMQVLEIGCGTGSTAIEHAPHVRHILATDVSENMLAIGRAKAEQAGIDNVDFQCVSVAGLSVADESMDMVLALNILHLLPDWRQVLSQLYRMLAPGGLLVSSTACLGDMGPMMKVLPRLMKVLPVLPSVASFSEEELAAAMVEAGFELEQRWLPGRDKAVFIVARKPGPEVN